MVVTCTLLTLDCSYLYPDGRSVNPDLSWAVQATPEDHVKVRVRVEYMKKSERISDEYCQLVRQMCDRACAPLQPT